MSKSTNSDNLLSALKILTTALKNVRYAVFGGVACAIHNGEFYRDHGDIEIIVEDSFDALKDIFPDLRKEFKRNRFRYKCTVSDVEVEFMPMTHQQTVRLADDNYKFDRIQHIPFKELTIPTVDVFSMIRAKQRHLLGAHDNLVKKISMDLEILRKAAKSQIRSTVPKIPDEVIEVWLLPHAEKRNWPPQNGDGWNGILCNETISFWNEAEWTKQEVDLSQLTFSNNYYAQINGLFDGYRGIDNIFSRRIADIKPRINKALLYILEYGAFPVAPILHQEKNGQYNILDGNHRFTAFRMAEKTFSEHAVADVETKQKFLKSLKLPKIVQPKPKQVIWVCRPKWELSTNGYLTDASPFDFASVQRMLTGKL